MKNILLRKKKKVNTKEVEKDDFLLENIQPQGGITFKEPNYILTGDGYTKIIHIYKLPSLLSDGWLDHICNIDNSVASVDIGTKNTAEVKKNINKAMKEELSRAIHATDFMEAYNANRRQEQLKHMYDELAALGEIVKIIHFRIFVSGRNLYELEEQTNKIMVHLESDQFLPTILLNEGKREYQSLWKGYEAQHQDPFAIKGHTLLTEQLAGGNPFHYSDLDDENGDFIGFTPCGGPVIFDEFEKSGNRKHYNSLVVGDMGSGKSTYLKKRFKSRASRGDYIRCFDVSGEFTELTFEFGGVIIRCDGKHGILNPFEILKAGDDDHISFSRHISKVSTFYTCFVPSTTDKEIIVLQNILREFYEGKNLVPAEDKEITGLAANQYPTLADFLFFIEGKMKRLAKEEGKGAKKALLEKELLDISVIQQSFSSLLQNYGNIFNGHTSIDNIVDEPVVTFDISMIKDLGNVFVAQLFNMVSLCWDNLIVNGTIMKEKYDTNAIDFEDITRFLILIDESHRWVNTKMPMILDLIILYLREARKYFGGISLASQSIRDYVPEGESEHLDKIKTVFELTQYKLMFKQDAAALPLIDKIFSHVLTLSQRQVIPNQGVGECILSIAGDKNLAVSIWMSKEYEEELFRGGA